VRALIDGISPRERHRFSQGVFIDRSQPHTCTSRPPPGSALGRERVGTIPDDLLLLVWCERDHATLPIVVQSREDSIIDAEVRVAHVRTFRSALQA
jgi:hypothetical protein